MSLTGKVALVTGAAGDGMGRSIALTLAREGAGVVVNYRNSARQAEAVVRQITAGGQKALAVQADVFDAEECRRLVHTVQEQFGCLDICVINPGGGWNPKAPVDLCAADVLDSVTRELAPIYHLLPLVLPMMTARHWGRIIGLGLAPPYNSPDHAYNLGKVARTQALLAWRETAWPHGVTVNILAPGDTPGIDFAQAVALCEHAPAWNNRQAVTPQDIAEAAAFLCSEAGRFISGMVLAFGR